MTATKDFARLAGAVRIVRDVSGRCVLGGNLQRLRRIRRICAHTTQAVDSLIDATAEVPLEGDGFREAIKTSAAIDFANAIKLASKDGTDE